LHNFWGILAIFTPRMVLSEQQNTQEEDTMRSFLVAFTVLAALIMGVFAGSARTTKASDASEEGLAAIINGPFTGQNVSVYFRGSDKDEIPQPVPLKADVSYGHYNFIQGKMLTSRAGWLELELSNGQHVLIPTHSIAYVITGLTVTTHP
jgi:hypothetical protein